MSIFSKIFKKKEKELKTLSLEEFGSHIIKTIEPELSHYQYELTNIDGMPNILVMNGENERARIGLTNHYQTYLNKSSDEERAQTLTTISQNLLSAFNEFEQDTLEIDGKLMPVIKPYSWLQQYANAEGKSLADSSMLCAPLAFEGTGDLCVVFAIDRGEDMMFVTKALFPDADVNDLYMEAVNNLQEYFIEQIKAEALKINEQSIGCFVSMDGNYESSLVLLMPPLIEHFMTIVGDPVFVLMARDTFIIADSDNKEQIEELKKAVERSFSELDYPLSPILYTYRDQTVYVYEE